VITNAALLANAADAVSALRMTADDEVLTLTPMFHVAGLNLLTTPALSIGATVTIHRQFCASSALEDIEARAVTLLVASPPMTAGMVADPAWDRTEMASLRCVVTGGTTVTERSVRPWHTRHVPVVQSYGMTEAGPHVTLVPIQDVPARSLTAGRPIMRSHVRIVDPTGREVERGSRGEIAVRGPAVMKEYWQNRTATRAALRDGWLRTGDVGFVDADGYLHVVDRLKEVIVVGVSNVYPADLESVLAESPDIEASAVVARADEQLGEVPVACVVPRSRRSLTAEGVLALFEGRLASYKHPRDVIFLDSLPRTSVGKPDKHALRKLSDARAGDTTRRPL
jgi:fatty-acyl-CoA synthase